MSDAAAPHGFEEDGFTPRAPYGLNVDGTPRKSNRGARPGQRGNGGSAAKSQPLVKPKNSDASRRALLIGLADMMITTPLAAAADAPALRKRLGDKQADALAGDSVIIDTSIPDIADGLIVWSQSKPGLLSWLDTVEDKAPMLMLLQAGVKMTKALIQNHMDPNPDLVTAGKLRLKMKARQYATMIQQEAAAMGLTTEVPAAA